MSKLIDKLKQLSGAKPEPMGFRRAKATPPEPRLLLIASVAGTDISNLADYVAGADGGLIRLSGSSSGAKAIEEISQTIADIPWGVWLKGGGQRETEGVEKTTCDFVVFPAANTSLAIFQGDEVGKILEVEPSLSEGLLRAVDELPIDAVFIGEEEAGKKFLTWYHLMLFQRFAALAGKPLLVLVPSNVTDGELQTLWETGVDGIVVMVELEKPPGRIKKLRQVIDKLTFPPKRKVVKTGALLPYLGGEEEEVVSGEEEE